MKVTQGSTVRVINLSKKVPDKVSKLFVNGRKLNKVGIVDSPLYDTFNHHWLVRHDTSRIVKGMSVGLYGVYHEDELEVIEAIQPPDDEPIRGQTSHFVLFDDDW